jgi:hypothetical protein
MYEAKLQEIGFSRMEEEFRFLIVQPGDVGHGTLGGCEDARLQYLMHCRDVALALCPNVGKHFNLLSSS